MDTLLRIVTQMEPAGRRPVVEAIDTADQRLAEALLVGLGDVEKVAGLVHLVPDDDGGHRAQRPPPRAGRRAGGVGLAEQPRRPLTS